ncbi:glycoside hydrolase family 2 protein [Lachnoclostridium sp. Marseille-P6806]|uniref:glycoside hydrolase family 2 protein n=1 Tax=Lachnoclostridium sp. Marseille-P6806 TaxID=2364793 RepID=UPI001F5EF102|nr:glycoside hydrolase family 2 protein [Lachnoclostridium sp. Marseille-P6806]
MISRVIGQGWRMLPAKDIEAAVLCDAASREDFGAGRTGFAEECGEVYGIVQARGGMPASVPGTVYGTLLANGLIGDPFWRDNELALTGCMDRDYTFVTELSPEAEERDADQWILCFDGIDTLADVYLGGRHLGSTDNMHRTWEFDVTELLRTLPMPAELRVVLHSPTEYIAREDERVHAGGTPDAMIGFPHIRKTACMFGWDWGPRLPDAGLFRPVRLLSVKRARLTDVRLSQRHLISGRSVRGNLTDSVLISLDTEVTWAGAPSAEEEEKLCTSLRIVSPDGSRSWGSDDGELEIDHPELWWPNGYGPQPLYTAEVSLLLGGELLDVKTLRIGLRTCTVNRDPLPAETRDSHMQGQAEDTEPGENFALEVNGLQIFSMGADYIPEDSLLARQSRERTASLLKSAAQCHMNTIRVWGGGYFPDNDFYELCDEYGLLVWQDFLFSCAAYELEDAFEENFSQEIRDNIRRLRHHACIAFWCGNNEMETQTLEGAWGPSPKQRLDYIKMFEYILPKLVKEEDPERLYWPSSPSSGGDQRNPWAENVGDAHYWGVWHGGEPFTAYRGHHYRFLSEFGFQSFPCLATVKSFTCPEDRNVYSRVMEMHQRNSAANGKIMNYLSQTYLYPKSFDDLLYCSQLLQADAIRYGVEHFRRFRGSCMGTVVWQLNDIWPVASWAGMDYFGRWKALQYAEKRMFAPVLLSCEEHGEIDQQPFPNAQRKPVDFSALLHVANETAEPFEGTVQWALRLPDSTVVAEGSFAVYAEPFGGTWLPSLDLNALISEEAAAESPEGRSVSSAAVRSSSAAGPFSPLDVHLSYALLDAAGERISGGNTLFCAPKHYHFADPELRLRCDGNRVEITAGAYAKAVAVESADGNLRLDDNFFDMEAGTVVLRIVDEDGEPAEEGSRSGVTGLAAAYVSRSFAQDELVACSRHILAGNGEEARPAAIPPGPYRVRSVYETALR